MLKRLNRLLAFAAALFMGAGIHAAPPAEVPNRTAAPTAGGDKNAVIERATRRRMLSAARAAAATRAQAALKAKGGKVDPKTLGVNPAVAQTLQASKGGKVAGLAPGGALPLAVPGPGFQLAQPDYMFATASNWHNTKPIHKFMDGLPGLGAANANNLGNFIPVAQPIPGVYNDGSDYYEIGVQEYTQKLHGDLNPTKLRGYKDLSPTAENTDNAITAGTKSNYLGPVIIAHRDKPVRIKMTNMLPSGPVDALTGRRPGDLFIPVDTTMMGAGLGPLGGTETYTQNRAEFHLHGGLNPWISDGTPHQWVTPAGETTNYKKGAAFQNVPDMAAGATDGDGIATYYWTNQQSGRFMFYHDHAFGLTRLNVYAGEAAGYLIVDPVEDKLINAGILPNNGGGVYNYGIPLVIQDKTFVDTTTLGTVGVAGGTDPTWDVTAYGGDGALWFPHVYMPNQNPADLSGANAMGRWDYGPWFWPPLTAAAGLVHGEEPIPGDPNGTTVPGTPNPSLTPESFMDTPVVNGAAYPKITVQPKAYRFRILNAANDRFWNLSFFQADPADVSGLDGKSTEVKMVVAAPGNATFPVGWPTDGRDGGVPDPTLMGPSFIQIGNESGFLPTPTVIAPQPVAYNYNRRDIVVLNVQERGLFLGPAMRADVVVDFSPYAGKRLILYNDAPAPVPAFDSRLDYYTGDPDQSTSGGAPTTLAGFGPNTRTLMAFDVAAAAPDPAYDMTALNAAFQSTVSAPGAFAESQHLPIIPQVAYNSALNRAVTTDVFARIQDYQARLPFASTENGDMVQPYYESKAIQELFELDYGRMNATLGVELPFTNFNIQTTIPLGYADPATENLIDGTTQFWKITHNGVDTHPVHFHLFDVQIMNRVGWDGAVRMPFPNELGWRETVQMNPLEDIVVAFRPLSPRLPFQLPNSLRSPNVTQDSAASISVTNPVDGNPITISNAPVNFGWEYVWHCHILGHEENDFMRAMVLTVATTVPNGATNLVASINAGANSRADLAWTDNATDETGFAILRSPGGAGTFTEIGTVVPNVRSFSDFNVTPGASYDYQVVAYNQAGNGAPSNTATVNAAASISISGLVNTTAGPLANVVLTLNPGGYIAVTAADGTYTATVPNGWSGTMTPSLLGYTFAPALYTYGVLAANQLAQNFTATPFATVTGNVTLNGAPLAGATITPSTGTAAITDALGNYTITTAVPWSGTVTATSGTLVFVPAVSGTISLTTPGQNAVQNFAAATATVSGTVTYNAAGLGGVTMTYTGGSTVTAADGTYSFTVTAGWTGTVTPSKVGYLFTAPSTTYTNLTVNTVTNYTAVAAVPIAGVIYINGVPIIPIAGVTVTFSGGAGTAITDANGVYSHDVPRGWTGTVTPTLAGFTFAPAARNYNNVTTVQSGQNYRGTAVIVLSGNVTKGGLPWSGVTITFSNGGGTATTDALGNYTRTLNSGWTGTVTASRNGYVFNPVNYTYANLTVNAPNLNFAVSGVNITGQVYINNSNPRVGVPGVTITCSNVGTALTDASGNFTITVPLGWTGTLTYSGLGKTYAPSVRSFTNVQAPTGGWNSRSN